MVVCVESIPELELVMSREFIIVIGALYLGGDD
jgi:hypothetical protein